MIIKIANLFLFEIAGCFLFGAIGHVFEFGEIGFIIGPIAGGLAHFLLTSSSKP